MNDIVVDSSVAAKWLLPESDSAQANRLAAVTAQGSGELILLDIALAEITNAIWKRCHQKLITLDEARSLLGSLLSAPVRVELAPRLLHSALEIATKYDRAIYDALFVALAADLDLDGVTADEPLYRAVRRDFPKITLLRDWVTAHPALPVE
jgi:predicted nucleic acid-binding protein